jgi:hypothetical protein
MPTTSKPGDMTDELNQIMGFNRLTKSDSGNIQQLLDGLPNPSLARNAAAYNGVQSGVPGSEYANNRGFDLYNTQADARRKSGHEQLLGLLQGVSGTAIATPGQQMASADASAARVQQGSQFNRSLDQETSQQNRKFSLQALLQGFDPSVVADYQSQVKPDGSINKWGQPKGTTRYQYPGSDQWTYVNKGLLGF